MAETASFEFDGGDDNDLSVLYGILPGIGLNMDDSVLNNPTTNNSETFINSLQIIKVESPVFLAKLVQTTSCCAVCTDDFGVNDDLTQLPYCGHWFHHKCILPWLKRNKNTCPLCRQKLFPDDIIRTQSPENFSDLQGSEFDDMLMLMLNGGVEIEDHMLMQRHEAEGDPIEDMLMVMANEGAEIEDHVLMERREAEGDEIEDMLMGMHETICDEFEDMLREIMEEEEAEHEEMLMEIVDEEETLIEQLSMDLNINQQL